MAKDPAFLFYYQDFIVGTTFMTLEDRGAYITLLCHLADKDTIQEKDIKKIIPAPIWDSICCKFEKEEKGFFNKRLRTEVAKRRTFTESRRKNLHKGAHMGRHMEAHMENENEDENKDEKKNKKSKVLNKKIKLRGDLKYFLETWNKKMPWKINEITPGRKKHLHSRLENPKFQKNFEQILNLVLASDFLSGRKPSKTHPNFKADFDWIIQNDENYIKILEGKYGKSETSEKVERVGKLLDKKV